MLLQGWRNHGDRPHCRHGLLRDQLQDVDDGDVAEALGDAQRRRPVLSQEDETKTRGQMSVCSKASDRQLEHLDPSAAPAAERRRLTDVISLG